MVPICKNCSYYLYENFQNIEHLFTMDIQTDTVIVIGNDMFGTSSSPIYTMSTINRQTYITND